MKIYVNELHQIRAIRVNDTGDETLKEIEVEDDFFSGWCDTVKLGFCYEQGEDAEGNQYIAIYPYKDFSLLESIQREHDETNQKIESAAVPPEVMLTARFAAMAFSDTQALMVSELYPAWSELPDGQILTKKEDVKTGTEITIVRGDDGKLYRVIKTHKKQADWEPGQATASLFTVIDVEHAGTIDDPIPAAVNMEYIKGKYYIEADTIYLMNREGMEDGEGVVLQYLPSQLVGQYFVRV